VSPVNREGLDDTHDLYDPSTLTNPSRQRQQQLNFDPVFASSNPVQRPSGASGSARSSRRVTPRLESESSSHRRTASVDAAARQHRDLRPPRQGGAAPSAHRAPGVGSADIAPALSEAETEGGASTTHDSYNQLLESYWPSRSTRVSPRTASAILWVLEEAIRKPFPFTPDWEELNASMSELAGPSGLAGPGGNGRTQNGGSRPSQGPRPVHTQVPAGVRTPTDIMRDRRDREARKKAEREAREREQQETEVRQQQEQEQNQPTQTQSYAAAGVAAGDPASQRRRAAPLRPAAGADPAAYTEQAPAAFQQPAAGSRRPDVTRGPGNGATQRPPAISQSQPRPVPSASQQPTAAGYPSQQQAQAQPRASTLPAQGVSQPGPNPSQRAQSQIPQSAQNPGQASQPQDQLRRSTFPHAFERWETLSSHWEGLTGYWIRKLEQNNNELSQDPLNQQMARQINDLSAAGANLFHAVVELQRLRASSERKFQRWFFDTRAEQEKARENQADLERQLKALRLEQADSASLRQKAEADCKKAEDLAKEMRRELQISKEEARRAWEELGRREQEERERTMSLRNGEPTLVGGVQVVPMIPGMPSRQNSTNRPPTREGPYPGGPGPSSMGGQQEHDFPRTAEESQYYEGDPDPFTEGKRAAQQEIQTHGFGTSTASQPPSSSSTTVGGPSTISHGQPSTSAAYSQGETGGHFYQHEGTALHEHPETSEPDDRSYVPSTEGSELGEEEYVINPDGSYRRDAQGRRVVYARSDEYEDEGRSGYEQPYVSGPESVPATSGAPVHGYEQGAVDYSGAGWGGWDSVTPRHRHPTRLSDVLEEDERSRTSPSRASQASRGLY
jgi:hypothetical protein